MIDSTAEGCVENSCDREPDTLPEVKREQAQEAVFVDENKDNSVESVTEKTSGETVTETQYSGQTNTEERNQVCVMT